MPARHSGVVSAAAVDPAIDLDGVTRDFGPLRAVDDVTLQVPRGVVFGFLGPNGAGKTTTIRLLLGLLTPSAGCVRVLGEELPAGGQRVRERCGVVLDHHGLYDGLTVRASLRFAAAGYGLGRAAAGERVESVVGSLGLADRLDERPSALSRGMRQRMSVARALVGAPDLLVLDEPTNGLDAEAAAGLRSEIAGLVADGTTVFLTTHLLAEAERLCDLVAVVRGGRVLAVGSPSQLRRRTRVTAARLEGPGVTAVLSAIWPRPVSDRGPDAARVDVDGLSGPEGVDGLVAALVAAGASVHRVEPEGQTLEAAFLDLVSAQDASAHDPGADGSADRPAHDPLPA